MLVITERKMFFQKFSFFHLKENIAVMSKVLVDGISVFIFEGIDPNGIVSLQSKACYGLHPPRLVFVVSYNHIDEETDP